MNRNLLKLTFLDLLQGLACWRIWLLLGWQDIRLRYRRSMLGPLWITLSMAVMIYSMGFLYAKLFKVDLSVYYPYLACGMILWNFIAAILNESTEAFFANAHFIKQIKLPYSTYIFRLFTRNIFIFLHNAIAIIPILIFFKTDFAWWSLPLFLLGFIMIVLCGFCFSFIIAIIGTRFQDLKQIIISLIQIFFLLTPIMWMPTMIPERFGFFTYLNPFYQLMTVVRQPLLGQIPSAFTYMYLLTFTAAGYIIMLLLMQRTRHRIAFWL